MNDCPIEQVRLTVPADDDPTLPMLTFRTWALGIMSCATLCFLNQFFSYRQNVLSISSVTAQILVLPIGRLMAATLPTKPIKVPMTKWTVVMNPGPFNVKEHVMITIFANAGYASGFAVGIITQVKAFYHRKLSPMAAFLVVQTAQTLPTCGGLPTSCKCPSSGNPQPHHPSSRDQVLHEAEVREKGGQTRLQFFLMVLVASFSYYLVPNYFFPSIIALSFACWIWKDSIKAQQIGSGLHGLGVGSFGFDWSTVSGFLGSPLATPAFAIVNILAGFFLYVYIITPFAYWTNMYEAKRFPLFSSHVFDANGQPYNTSRVLNEKNFEFDRQGYDSYSKIYLSIFFVFACGFNFATLTATLSHVALFHGRTIAQLWRQTVSTGRTQIGDIHTRLMKENYETVPQWWFYTILASMIALAALACEGFGKQLQLPFWGILLACALALFFTLPIGVIAATTNQQPSLNVITELVIGYLYPGRPLANVTFRTYGFMSTTQAITFLGDFKLGQYMKIPPKSMFIVQVKASDQFKLLSRIYTLVGTVVASMVSFCTSWWMLTTINHICDPSKLPEGSPWTCPVDDVVYNESIIWGLVGPLRMFGHLGLYSKINYFLIGLLAPMPVWLLARSFPNQKWIKLINMPIIFYAACNMPPVRSVNFLSWGAVGIFFNLYVYRRYKGWWARHNYILSTGLDAGVAFMGILCYLALQENGINGVKWWGMDVEDHCPLAHCPTAKGIVVDGCPHVH
ncbi:hypothetical protein ACLOJK_041683 [Asimina triloba]